MLSLIFLFLFFLIGLAITLSMVKFAQRSLSVRQHLWLFAGCITYGVSPMLFTWIGFIIAQYFDCGMMSMAIQCSKGPWLGNVAMYLILAFWSSTVTIPFALVNTAIVVSSLLARRLR